MKRLAFKQLPKAVTHFNQKEYLVYYLQEHIATASMAAEATGIPQKNICRYKRELQKAGNLWEIGKGICRKTGFKASYLTANSKSAKGSMQLNFFSI